MVVRLRRRPLGNSLGDKKRTGVLPSSRYFLRFLPSRGWAMIPAARQRVCIEGRTGLYFVLSVN